MKSAIRTPEKTTDDEGGSKRLQICDEVALGIGGKRRAGEVALVRIPASVRMVGVVRDGVLERRPSTSLRVVDVAASLAGSPEEIRFGGRSGLRDRQSQVPA